MKKAILLLIIIWTGCSESEAQNDEEASVDSNTDTSGHLENGTGASDTTPAEGTEDKQTSEAESDTGDDLDVPPRDDSPESEDETDSPDTEDGSDTPDSADSALETAEDITTDEAVTEETDDTNDTEDSESTATDDSQEAAETDTSSALDTEAPQTSDDEPLREISIQSQITAVQPMTGIVLWNDHGESDAKAIQLEYAYMGYNDIAVDSSPDAWDWSSVENRLDNIASHDHQGVLRFFYVYPGRETTVPDFVKVLSDYSETNAQSEGRSTGFPDWSHETLKDFTKQFYSEFATRYDTDPRLAFLEVGFGLWAEYHIYDPGEVLGDNFPDKAFQTEFFNHLDSTFQTLRWLISIDAADSSNTPFESTPALIDIPFGLFDDSFLHENHGDYNKACFDFFGEAKRQNAPVGGELSYYSDYDQQHALDLPDGPHGITFETLAASYNVSFMIGNDQPDYQPWDRIEEAGMALGYKFEIESFEASSSRSEVQVKNTGIAPFFYDAYVTVNGVRAEDSLKQLLPGESKTYIIQSGGNSPTLTITCDRLVEGQEIQFTADL